MKRAVVLLSGGLDSTTTLATTIAEGYETYALSFEYGQRHKIELDAARRIARALGAKEHRVAKIDMRIFGGSALTDDVDVPKKRSVTEIGHGIPVTYVPARNTIFLSYALALAETVGARDISSEQMQLITAGIRIAGRSSSQRLKRSPTSQQRPVSKARVFEFTHR
jgi:Predicted PP-loop superfamily ATPase